MGGGVEITESSGELSAEEKRQQRLQALANRGINQYQLYIQTNIVCNGIFVLTNKYSGKHYLVKDLKN